MGEGFDVEAPACGQSGFDHVVGEASSVEEAVDLLVVVLVGGQIALHRADQHERALDIAIGEAQIWSQPWRAPGDLRDYDATFPSRAGISWELQPMGTGVQLAIRF